MAQPAGKGATIEYRFRNGTTIELTAHEINVPKLLEDVKAYIKTRPRQMEWEKMNVGDIGWRLVTRNQQQYLGKQVAAWQMEVKPRAEHFDKRVTITTPLQKAGAYLVKATMAGGNTNYIVVWLNDTSIVKKPLDRQAFYYVGDAASGAPVPKANMEFFGWRQNWIAQNHVEILVQELRRTDRRRRPARHGPEDPAAGLPVAHHGHHAGRPIRLRRLHWRLVWPAVRCRVQRHKGLHDHRSARLSAGSAGEVQVLGRTGEVRSARGKVAVCR